MENSLGDFKLDCSKQGDLLRTKINKKNTGKCYFDKLTEEDIDEKRKYR